MCVMCYTRGTVGSDVICKSESNNLQKISTNCQDTLKGVMRCHSKLSGSLCVGSYDTDCSDRSREVTWQRIILFPELLQSRAGEVSMSRYVLPISNRGVSHHHATPAPYNTQHLRPFFSELRDIMLGNEQQTHEQAAFPA